MRPPYAPPPDLSLVMPYYNPGGHFAGHVAGTLATLRRSGASFEVLLVDDGSTDGSPAVAADLAAAEPEPGLTLLALAEHRGKGAALRSGFARCTGAWMGFIDADGDLPAPQLERFVAAARDGSADAVIGSKTHPSSHVRAKPVRRLATFGYRLLVRFLFRLPLSDTQTGLKLFRRDVVTAVLGDCSEDGYVFDLELLVRARRAGFTAVTELPVDIVKRDTSTIRGATVLRIFADTVRLWWVLQRPRARKHRGFPWWVLQRPRARKHRGFPHRSW